MSEAREPSSGAPTTERVRGIFSRIAPRYDAFNLVSSFGLDRLWRRTTVRMAGLTPESDVLDLAAGTGDLTLAIARHGRPASVMSTDFVEEMLEVGKRKAARYDGPTRISFAHADAQALPFPDASFDVVTIAFGVRNLPDRAANFREVRRVLRPGGRYVILEFSTPQCALFRAVYHAYLGRVIPALGALIAGDRASFEYLNASIRAFPKQAELARELEAAGFSRVRWRNLTGGIVAVHVAEV
ncbi:MAG: bifunctional demethylmenaquinone methyltransferase/2-methoxy-6-polyprenyl-1,4-benzoquinol methylase UbiE [Anaerosomatales bacterium]|nr:bifunctional demethylmenaquinone methyltransferase/2-methoxy-6-polyprenyl-1,4-benzoquinol methylase UbiE [Anaerosomatales bacterium]